MMRVDTTELESAATQCFDNSMDGRFTPDQRAAFLAEGKRLRAVLTTLLSAQFDDGTPQVVAANVQIKAVNAELKTSAANLAQTAETLNNIARLVGTIDGLLGLAI